MSSKINTTNVRIEDTKRKITQRLFNNSIPGSNKNPIDTLGFDGLTISVKGYATTSEDYDTIVAEIMAAPFKLYLKDDWYYNAVLKEFGVSNLNSDNYFPFDMRLSCEEPYMYSDEEINIIESITTNNQKLPSDSLTVTDFQLNPGTGTFSYPALLNDNTTDPTYTSSVAAYVEVDFGDDFTITEFRHSGHDTLNEDGSFKIQHWNGTSFVDNTTGIVTRTGSFSDWISLTTSIVTSKVRIIASVIDSNGYIKIRELEMRGFTIGRAIVTNGTVNTIPDIKLTAGEGSGYGGTGVEDEQYDGTEHSTPPDDTYTLMSTLTHSAVSGKAWNVHDLKYKIKSSLSTSVTLLWKITITTPSLYGGVETNIVTRSQIGISDIYADYNDVVDETTGHNEDVVLKFYLQAPSGPGQTGYMDEVYSYSTEQLLIVVDDVQVYNIADTTRKCDMCGLIHPNTVIRINSNGSGTYQYSDDFSNNKFYYDTYYYVNATFNTDKADIAASGYIEYVFDLKYPITGIPTLLSQIDVTAGTPTIKIAVDVNGLPDTYYDIDTAIVDDVSTEYELDDETNLRLKGETKFWVKIECDASAACSVKSLQLDVDIVTIDVTMPVINTGAANTFRCDQSSDSSLACEVELIYHDRKWT